MSTIEEKTSTYAQGHTAAVIASHQSRTVNNSAVFLLPYLQPHQHILDMGCGPGTITVGFHDYVPRGSVTGIDFSSSVISRATESFPPSKYPNLKFEEGNPLAPEGLKYDDNTFDVIYTSQAIMHMPDPTTALKEAYRVLKPDGILAMRETDILIWYPPLDGLVLYNKILDKRVKDVGAPGLGKAMQLPSWARQAGFDRNKMIVNGGAMVYATAEERKFWANTHIGRIMDEQTRQGMKKTGATEEDLEAMIKDFKRWEEDVDAWFNNVQVELICRK